MLANAPADQGSEVAFAGRSNAGKSSAINALTGNKKLARTSKIPGRTQLINFFTVDSTRRIVDLPGYGFAKVPINVKKEWNRQLEKYLQFRESLKGLILLMDVRHPLTDYDAQMLTWCHQSDMPTHVLLTKSDKLKRGPAKATLFKVRSVLDDFGPLYTAQLFSSASSAGLMELESVLAEWLLDSV